MVLVPVNLLNIRIFDIMTASYVFSSFSISFLLPHKTTKCISGTTKSQSISAPTAASTRHVGGTTSPMQSTEGAAARKLKPPEGEVYGTHCNPESARLAT
eukprot:GHVT01093773.1.p3 GENE.GHVT01093773.1~~GHVT01093773.1.p3  ORF type:complete len:100 (-),score=4.97 GHVT01093773.1:981-1280(-)